MAPAYASASPTGPRSSGSGLPPASVRVTPDMSVYVRGAFAPDGVLFWGAPAKCALYPATTFLGSAPSGASSTVPSGNSNSANGHPVFIDLDALRGRTTAAGVAEIALASPNSVL